MTETTAAPGGTEAPASIADELRQMHDGLAAEREPETFLLPGYGEKLQVEYRVLTADEQDEIGQKIAEQVRSKQIDNPVFMGYLDNLINASVCFYTVRNHETVPLHVALEGEDAKPIRWGDPRLAALVGLEAAEGQELRARHIVRGVLADDRLALSHGQEVTRWMERSLEEVRTDF